MAIVCKDAGKGLVEFVRPSTAAGAIMYESSLCMLFLTLCTAQSPDTVIHALEPSSITSMVLVLGLLQLPTVPP